MAQSYKEYLVEYYKYFNSFSEVIDKHEDDNTKEDDLSSDGEEPSEEELECDELEDGDNDKEEYDPCKFRQWMELSIAGEN